MEFDSPEFHQAVAAAGRREFLETLAAGLPVFYLDTDGLNVMEQPDGRRFEVEWIPGAPGDSNYRVIRELRARAA